MMSVGNVETGHLSKFFRDSFDVFFIRNNPELVSEAIDGGNEIVFGLHCCVMIQKVVEYFVVRISEEYRFDVSITYTNMLHTVFFLIAACEFVLFNNSGHVVIHECPYN